MKWFCAFALVYVWLEASSVGVLSWQHRFVSGEEAFSRSRGRKLREHVQMKLAKKKQSEKKLHKG